MHDSRQDAGDEPLAGWMRDALRAPVDSSSTERDAIMARVRRLRAPHRLQPPLGASRWSRRGLLNPLSGMATVAMLIAVVSMRALEFGHGVRSLEAASLILGDSVVPASGSSEMSHERLHEAVHETSRDVSAEPMGSRLLDTLRIVEFVLRGRDVRSVTVVGDFNAWQRGVTTLHRAGSDRWRARVLVPRDALRFAYVVNETQLIAAPPLQKAVDTRRTIPDSI